MLSLHGPMTQVKGGEDLRLDQRIEQLFSIMNEILRSDSACAQRGIFLTDYQVRIAEQAELDSLQPPPGNRCPQVIPMTSRLGLLEWVPNTDSAKSLIISRRLPTRGDPNLFGSDGRDDERAPMVTYGRFVEGWAKKYRLQHGGSYVLY